MKHKISRQISGRRLYSLFEFNTGRTDGRTRPLIEIRSRIEKPENWDQPSSKVDVEISLKEFVGEERDAKLRRRPDHSS